jgi:hypothetical protein
MAAGHYAVVVSELHVRCVDSLRVADASAFPL